VRSLAHPLAKALAAATQPGDVLLETGCGSATLSAELALAGRVVELCDFSEPILKRAERLFEVSSLPKPKCTKADLTQPLPWPDQSVDWVWSSGVLEHWTDEELLPIVREMVRVSRKGVISLVPNARCVLYRLGKHLAEANSLWPYGRELPRATQRGVFEAAGLRNIREWDIWNEMAPAQIPIAEPYFNRAVASWWASLPLDDPARTGQGYLLFTIGER
jgi:ubiquinone/menaquinone biosynthesis C-methylase UbiE